MEEVVRFIRSQPSRQFEKGQILIYQGDVPDMVFGIRSGFVKVHDMSPGGAEQLIWIAKRRDVVPLEWLFGDVVPSPFFYTAFTDVDAYAISKQSFLDFLKTNNESLLAIIELITRKHYDIMQLLNAAQKPKAREKIITALDYIAQRFSSDLRPGVVDLPLKHQDIANLVGLTRETTANELRKLKQEGCVDYDKTKFIIYTDKLGDN